MTRTDPSARDTDPPVRDTGHELEVPEAQRLDRDPENDPTHLAMGDGGDDLDVIEALLKANP